MLYSTWHAPILALASGLMGHLSPRVRARCAHVIQIGTVCASSLPRDGLCSTLTIVYSSSFATFDARPSVLARP